jgi:alpha-beta hydrolase superfamily lysophospholipase
VTLGTQAYGTGLVVELPPASLLLVHGTEDRDLPPAGSEDLLERATTPAELRLIAGARHDFAGHADEVQDVVLSWLRAELTGTTHTARSAP